MNKFFKRSEFECKCGCGFDTVDTELLWALLQLRIHFKSPVKITSGCRCAVYNKRIEGAPQSRHLLGQAADIQVKRVRPKDVAAWLEAQFPNTYGIGLYGSWVHLDIRADKTRW